MKIRFKWPVFVVGITLMLGLTVGAAVVYAQASSSEGDTSADDLGETAPRPGEIVRRWLRHHRNPGALPQGPLARLRRSDIDWDRLLADALDISVDGLQEARLEARVAGIQQGVAEEIITQEEADLIIAVISFKETVSKKDLAADALGITVDELERSIASGVHMRELLDELDLTAAEFREELRTSFEEAVEEGVLAGEITSEQGDLILALERPARIFQGFHGRIP